MNTRSAVGIRLDRTRVILAFQEEKDENLVAGKQCKIIRLGNPLSLISLRTPERELWLSPKTAAKPAKVSSRLVVRSHVLSTDSCSSVDNDFDSVQFFFPVKRKK